MSAHPQEQLSAFLDGELRDAERAELQAHLRGCEQCARELEELALVDRLAREAPVEAPAGYFEELPGRLRTRLRAARVAAAPARPRALVPRWAWAAAALVLMGVLIPLTWTTRRLEAPAARQAPPAANEPQPLATLAPGPGADAVRKLRPGVAPPSPLSEVVHDEAEAPARSAPPQRRESQAAASGSAAPGGVTGGLTGGRFAEPPPAQPRPQEAARERDDKLRSLGYVEGQEQPEADRSAAGGTVARNGRLEEKVVVAGASPPVTLAGGDELRKLEAPAAKPAAPPPAPVAAPTALPSPPPAATKVDGYAAADAEEIKDVEVTTRAESGARLRDGGRKKAADEPKFKGPVEGFESLSRHTPRTAAEARVLRRGWRAFADQNPGDPRADEARVRAIEAAALAARLSGERYDRDVFEQDLAAYLARPDAAQKDRARALRPDRER